MVAVTPRPTNTSPILPSASTGTPCVVQAVQIGGAGWRKGEIAPVLRARELAGTACERARDHPRDAVPALQDLPGYLAPLVERLQGHDVNVGGHLKDAVGRRVDDGFAGGKVLLAQFVDDDRPRGRSCCPAPPARSAP